MIEQIARQAPGRPPRQKPRRAAAGRSRPVPLRSSARAARLRWRDEVLTSGHERRREDRGVGKDEVCGAPPTLRVTLGAGRDDRVHFTPPSSQTIFHSSSRDRLDRKPRIIDQHHLGQALVGFDVIERHGLRHILHRSDIDAFPGVFLGGRILDARACSPRRCRRSPCFRPSDRRSPDRQASWPACCCAPG